MEGPAPFDTNVAPPPADDRRADAYVWLPYGNAEEGSADPRDSSLRDIHRPY